MKRLYLMLLLAVVLLSISAVSATNDLSVSNDTLEADNVDEMPLQNQTDASLGDESQSGDSSVSGTSTTDVANDTKKVQVPSKATAKNVKSTYGTPAKFKVKLTDQDGDAIAGKKVTFKVNDKVFKIKTDSKGTATLKLNYKAGKYTIKYSVAGFTGKNTYTVNNKITLTIMKWGNKGDVSKVKLIKKNMPDNKWVKKAVDATKKGNPLLKFQGGKGKTVFITAGVHGNELSSQVAAMKIIKYLSKHPIKGTVYVIPFVNIKAITHKVRHTGTDYNRVAHKSGTISNKIVNLVSKYDCDAYGDFHTTQPGGIPGKDIVMGSISPAKKCKEMTNYIAKHAKVNKKIYKYAGEQYPGALADNVNKKGIRAVICEVMLPHNTVTTKTVKTSYSMMKSLLKYNSVI